MRIDAAIGFGLGAVLAAASAHAEVAAAAPYGFKVNESASIAAPPDAVWKLLVKPAKWWSPDHTWSHNAANLKLDPKAGGCWCEAWPGGGAVHMTVVYVSEGKELRLSGAIGPMQLEGVAGSMVMTVTPEAAGSSVKMTYTAGGFSDPALDKLAPAVDRVLGAQLASLKAKAEAK